MTRPGVAVSLVQDMDNLYLIRYERFNSQVIVEQDFGVAD